MSHRTLSLFVCLVGAFSVCQTLLAAPFVFSYRDLMLCFRKTGLDGGSVGPYDLEVNIGQASLYYGATPGSTNTIGQFASTQISSIFDNLNDLSWSATRLEFG